VIPQRPAPYFTVLSVKYNCPGFSQKKLGGEEGKEGKRWDERGTSVGEGGEGEGGS